VHESLRQAAGRAEVNEIYGRARLPAAGIATARFINNTMPVPRTLGFLLHCLL
jgi:hypothetical protein